MHSAAKREPSEDQPYWVLRARNYSAPVLNDRDTILYNFVQELALGLPNEEDFTADFTNPYDRQVIMRGIKSIRQEIAKDLRDFQAYLMAIECIQYIFENEINNSFRKAGKSFIYNSQRFEEMAIFARKSKDVGAFQKYFSDDESKNLGREQIRKLVAVTYEEFLQTSPLGEFVKQIKINKPGAMVDSEAKKALYEHSEDDFIKAILCNISASSKFELLIKLLPQKKYDDFVNKFLQRIAFIQMHEEGIHTLPLDTPLKFSPDLINKFNLFILEFRRILYGDPKFVRPGDQRRCNEFSQHLKDLMLVELGLYQNKQADDSKEVSPLSAGTPGISCVNGASPSGSTAQLKRSLTPDFDSLPLQGSVKVASTNTVVDFKARSALQSPKPLGRSNTTSTGITLAGTPTGERPVNQLSLTDQAGLARLLSVMSKSDEQFSLSVQDRVSLESQGSVNSHASSHTGSPLLKKGS